MKLLEIFEPKLVSLDKVQEFFGKALEEKRTTVKRWN